MKRLILPILVIAASGAYVWSQQGRLNAEANFGTDLPSLNATVDATANRLPAVDAPLPIPAPVITSNAAVTKAAPELSSLTMPSEPARSPPAAPLPTLPPVTVTQASIPLPRPRPATAPKTEILLASATLPSATGLKDGSYKGPAANAYYGLIQVQAEVQNGQLVKVKILQYPSDRRTSRYINSQALPMLQQEAIQGQTGRVDYISGATLTSGAFAQSLTAALNQAH